MKFVGVDKGWVNLDHVARITQYTSREDKRQVVETFYTAENISLGARTTYERLDYEVDIGPCVAATPDEHAVVIWDLADREHEGEGDVYIERPRIVAWVIGAWAKPVFLEPDMGEASSGKLVFFKDSGEALRLAETNFVDLEAAKQHAKDWFAKVRADQRAKSVQPGSDH